MKKSPPVTVKPPRVSVIVPCYMSSPWLKGCLSSIAEQTLDPQLFEVVLVFNGPDDGASSLAEELLDKNGLRHQILHSDPGAPCARNVGTARANGEWHTFVDVDDHISPNYLEALLAAAHSPETIPVATMVDIDENGTTTPSAVHQQVMEVQGEVSPTVLWRPLSVTVLKLIPAALSRRWPFDTSLRSGEDVALFFSMFDAENLNFDTTPAHGGATYHRRVRQGSVGRQSQSFDFMVTQRLLVIAVLERSLARNNHRLAGVISIMIRSQAGMVAEFLRLHPDRLQDIRDEVNTIGLKRFPWSRIPVPSNRLIISYCFAPYADPSAVVVLKRSLVSGQRSNVISADMSTSRTVDKTLRRLASQVVAEHRVVEGPSTFSNWEGIERFCLTGMVALEDIESSQGTQEHMYSRAMFPASHFLGALIKGRRPDTEWVAEFSDPLRKNIHGAERPGQIGRTELTEELAQFTEKEGWSLPEGGTIFDWAEKLPFILADRLIFTNPHQLSYMMRYLDDERLRNHVLDRSVVQAQPTLPPDYYLLGRAHSAPDPAFVNLAYFGSFYPTRGLGDVLAGLRLLPPAVAAALRIHVFTASMDSLAEALEGHPARQSVVAYNPLPYLDFLRASRNFDVLLINDAHTLGSDTFINPYLPSKLSDYLGSGRPIWGMVEPGSMLSRHELAHKTRLGDAKAAARILSNLAEGMQK